MFPDSNLVELAMSFDRSENSLPAILLDDEPVSSGKLTVAGSTMVRHKVWTNSRQQTNKDTGFRISLYRFSMYADGVPPEALARDCESCTLRQK